ncbi:DUF397 domain-containing protein [Streptomyces sp. B6B3]|uniref:DUF397 domain-containing protein n=1 Tax=Streptomyces sp. B6B3 TaxID=3153570 RepID=UPI00325D9890
MTKNEVGTAAWRTSSHSNGNGGNCVEVADGVPGLVPVRDSKDRAGSILLIRDSAWSPFLNFLAEERLG